MPENKWIRLALSTEHPELLQGLESLRKLGLISDKVVRNIGRSHLSCSLPDPQIISESDIPQDWEEITVPIPSVLTPKIPTMPPVLSRFFEELSVRWLLFLGVFLVVLSSGVLVASQWANFPAVGQYLVLWSYTAAFGWVGFWASKQKELTLTSQTLQTVAILLVPLNFWAVDQFGVWRSPWQSVVAIAAIFGLFLSIGTFAKKNNWSKPIFTGFFALGLFQWGWETFLNPIVGVYLGISVIIVILWGIPLFAKRSHPQKIPENIGLEFLLFGLGLLLFRAIAIVSIPIGELGLGVGMLGWLLTELEANKIERSDTQTTAEAIAHPWETGGALLLVLGWLATVGSYPWQVLGVSALAVVWLIQKLRRDWRVEDLIALFVVGLQGGILCRDVIPTSFRSSVTTAAVEFSQAQDFPYSVYSVTLLPYLLIWAVAAIWFYRTDKKRLARTSEYLLLGLGAILAVLSLPNPTWRALNFSISAGVWFYFAQYSRPYLRQKYLYLSHGMGLLAIAGIFERIFPQTSFLVWGYFCLFLVITEWTFYLLPLKAPSQKKWQWSSWQFGIGLALGSWILLALAPLGNEPLYRLGWAIVPCFLTAIALNKKGQLRRQAVTLSHGTLMLLTFGGFSTIVNESGFMLGLGSYEGNVAYFLRLGLAIALGLMLINVRLMPLKLWAHLHLLFGTALAWSFILGDLREPQWPLFCVISSGIFWGFTTLLQRHRRYLGRLYTKVCHQWGFVFAGLASLLFVENSLAQWEQYWLPADVHPEIFLGSGLLLIVLLLRYWQNPKNEAFVMAGIAIETGLTEGVLLQGDVRLAIAAGNLIFAALFWLLQQRILRSKKLAVWQAYPLLFTLMGLGWRMEAFNSITGLITAVAGLLFLAIAAQTYHIRPLRFLGFGCITWGIYETVIYQMRQSPGDNIGDGLTVLALVGILLALIYRVTHAIANRGERTVLASIPLKEFLIIAHLHWAIAAAFKLFTLPYILPTPPTFRILAIATNIGLALYAIIQANTSQNPDAEESKWAEWWIYVGAIELITTSIQARWMWTQLETVDPFRVLLVSLLALMIFQLPWKNMGWQQAPWHRVGIAMPALCLVMTASSDVSYLSLGSITLVYLRIAQIQKNVRWGYLSLIFGNWLIGKILFAFDLLQPLSYALQIGLSILLIAQIDPDFQDRKKRSTRHLLRMCGSALICVIALIYYQEFGITPAIISLAFVFLGIGTQVRAFLYNGTITLIVTGIYQLVILIDSYSFAKWVVGLVAGIFLISVAANFEKRRLQILKVLQNWVEELEHWQ
ncbi:hypothetical protein Lepto7376_0956 [[Leptolyngbya] sp. PCC 7376]|uniref:hypothetical protein n=1 Tax=[Leptolyngbya] sp. PCC 7376 TaxID=111781 RepID=UPI00029EDFD2|nr:hypothetical protein [[Leptolyngbya] sp. PCC 7376]AFY37330.1 hypothetical protein Lepto7376_0956 [[Leptolyngbya] sp. PCC 7376]